MKREKLNPLKPDSIQQGGEAVGVLAAVVETGNHRNAWKYRQAMLTRPQHILYNALIPDSGSLIMTGRVVVLHIKQKQVEQGRKPPKYFRAHITGRFNRGMNGLAYGLREPNQVNYLNPASYSSVDSLTFVFDVGVSLQLTNFEENGKKVNARNADFEYAVATFRAARHLGVSFGILPFSNVGYSYSNTQRVNEMPSPTSANTSYTNSYTGEGGLHQIYLGAGWEPFRGFSIGANLSYLWGNYTRSVVNSYSDAYVNTLSKKYTAVGQPTTH